MSTPQDPKPDISIDARDLDVTGEVERPETSDPDAKEQATPAADADADQQAGGAG